MCQPGAGVSSTASCGASTPVMLVHWAHNDLGTFFGTAGEHVSPAHRARRSAEQALLAGPQQTDVYAAAGPQRSSQAAPKRRSNRLFMRCKRRSDGLATQNSQTNLITVIPDNLTNKRPNRLGECGTLCSGSAWEQRSSLGWSGIRSFMRVSSSSRPTDRAGRASLRSGVTSPSSSQPRRFVVRGVRDERRIPLLSGLHLGELTARSWR